MATFPLLQRQVLLNAAGHVAQGRGIATDFKAYFEPVYAPCDGQLYRFGGPKDEGGYWLGIHTADGKRLEFAHLSKYLAIGHIKEGQAIAISGNTGTLTTGPHLHTQIFDAQNNRIDPELFLSPKNIPIIAVNGTIEIMQAFQEQLLHYSAGMLTCSWDIVQAPVSVQAGTLTQDQAYALSDSINDPRYAPFRYVFMFYPANPTSTFLLTYYYPKNDQCIITCPLGVKTRNLVFEISHALQDYQSVHGNPLSIVDQFFPSDTLIISKLRSVLPNIDTLVK